MTDGNVAEVNPRVADGETEAMTDEQYSNTTHYPRAVFREYTADTAEKPSWTVTDAGQVVTLEDLSSRLSELLRESKPRAIKAALAGWLADLMPSKLWRIESWLQQYAWTTDEHLHVNGQVVHLLARERRGGLYWKATYHRGSTGHLLSAQSNLPGTTR